MNHISENLKKLLDLNNLTMTDMSRDLNIKQPLVYNLVHGKNDNPTINTLKPIADYFKVSIDFLISNNNS